VSISGQERDGAFVVRQAVELSPESQREAAERLGIRVRQFKRLVRAGKRDGDAGPVPRQRARPSSRRMSEALLEPRSSRIQPKRFARCRSAWACGSRSAAERTGCSSSASGVRDSVS
jgi:transposase